MSLNHDFFVVDNNFDFTNYRDYFSISSDVFLHDDFMRYINDTLNWIPTLTTSSSELRQIKGLNLYGITVIDFNGAGKLYKIIDAWNNLLSESPKKVILTGDWTQEYDGEGNVIGNGYYERLEFDRDDLLKHMNGLKNYSNQIVQNHSGYILHLGI
ncbi:MAG: hypothetical protein J7641_15535 [Cyanobacteria bacterium SID2]|nr:hypothetical protein [Cyanobacteria bacterium SID2]